MHAAGMLHGNTVEDHCEACMVLPLKAAAAMVCVPWLAMNHWVCIVGYVRCPTALP